MAETTRAVKGRVLLIGNFLSGRGWNRHVCEDLAERLQGRGWRVIAASDRRGRAARMLHMLETVVRRRREYDVAHVDVFSGPAFAWAEAACWALRRVGKPYVLTLHGGNLPLFARGAPRRVTRLLRSAHTVTTPSRYLLEAMGEYRADLELLPNAIDLAAYPYRPRARPAPRLVWLRAFERIYNPSLAPRVLAALPGATLTMIGVDKEDGSLAETERTAAACGVADRLRIVPGVPKREVPRHLAEADIFINTSTVDNAPVSVVEAMACGLCVVSTRVGGIPFLLDDGADALLVPPDDAQAMAAAIRRLLEEPGLAEHISQGARAKAERFDWGPVLDRWEAILGGASLALG